MRGGTPPLERSAPGGLDKSSSRRAFQNGRTRSPGKTQESQNATTTARSSKERLAVSASLTNVGGENWISEESQAPRPTTMRLFQEQTCASYMKSPTSSVPSLSRRPMLASRSGLTKPLNGTLSSGFGDPSPRTPGSPGDAVPKRKMRISERPPPELPNQPFHNTTGLAMRKMMTSTLKDAAEKDTKRKHVLQHLGNRSQNGFTDGIESSDRRGSGETPYEVLARGPRAHIHFLKALKFGTQRPRTLKLMFVGQGRAGKTSTLRRLTGRGFDKNEASTHGVSCENTFKTTTDLVSSWKVLGRPELEMHKSEFNTTLAREIVASIKEDNVVVGNAVPSSTSNVSMGSPETSPTNAQKVMDDDETDLPDTVLHNTIEHVASKMPVDLITRYLEHGEDGEPEESLTLKTWDFAGQQEYYAMHHLFLTNRGIYLVVTRLDLWLPGAPTDIASPLFEEHATAPPDSDVILDGPDGASDPPLHALTFWLSSIHIHAPNSIVVIVGTHKDKILGQEEEVYTRVEEEIQSLLERVPGVDGQLAVNQELGLCFFPIDNSHPASVEDAEDASGIAALRQALDHLARDALAEGGCFGEALPLKWVQLREELGEMAEGSTGAPGESLPMTALFAISQLRLLEIARGLGIKDDDELRACLQYLHDTGSIVFFDEPELRDNVVLNPQWLTDAMAHVLNCPRVVRGANTGAKLLREKGELDARLLREHLWKAAKFREYTRILLPLLHRYDLLLPYHSGDVSSSMSATMPRISSDSALTAKTPGSMAGVHIADCSTLLVPCLLPSSPPPAPGVPAPEVAVWNALFFDFHGMLCRLLPTLFPKLLVAATRHPEIEGPLSSLGVFRDSFKLLWGSAQLAFELLPAGSRPQVVRVRLERWVGSGGPEARSTTGLPVRIVRELLTLVRTSLSQHDHITFSAGILCEHCHARGRRLSEQHHVIDLSELLGQAGCSTSSSSTASPPGTIICRAQREVVEVPEQSWAGQWRKEVAMRSLGRCQGNGLLADLRSRAEETGHQELFSDGDSIIQMDEALMVQSIPSSVSSEVGMTTSRTDRVGANGNAWRLNLLYASPLCYATEEGHLGAALPGSTPADLPQINIEAELALLWEAMGPPEEEVPPLHERSVDSIGGSSMAMSSRCGVIVDLATASKLRQLLTSGAGSDRRLLLHLSLHCVEGGRAVLMEDGNGGAHAISLEAFEELVRAGGSLATSVGFIFVNACSSDQLGRVLISLGVPHVICCQGAVFDAVARCFTKAFYLACSRGFTIEQAFDVARAEVRASPQPGLRGEAEKYMLLGAAMPDETEATWHNPHAISLFEAAAPTSDNWGNRSARSFTDISTSSGSSLAAASFWRPSEGGRVPPRTEDFCGRGRDIWAIQMQLSIQRRCLTCNGEAGIGKSTLLMELARFASAPGRRFSGAVVYASLGANRDSPPANQDLIDPGKTRKAESESFSLRRFLTDVVEAVNRASGKTGGENTPPMEECIEDEGGPDGLEWCAQHMKGTLVRLMKKLENQRNGGEALLIIDDLDAYLLEPSLVEEVRKILIEVLLRTERTMLVLGSRHPIQGTLCSHKVVALSLTPLKPGDAARLFLWRVHRPLTLRDLSSAGIGSDLPLVYDPRNRQMVLNQVANHPLLQACRGHPGEIRRIADLVRPGLGGKQAPSLYDIYEEVFETDDVA